MSNEAFKEGDVVELKSGGPKMTIKRIFQKPGSKRTMAFCGWFDNQNRSQSESFELEALKKAE
jgi:uncharacterized protein YodC (DUF2158 family)